MILVKFLYIKSLRVGIADHLAIVNGNAQPFYYFFTRITLRYSDKLVIFESRVNATDFYI